METPVEEVSTISLGDQLSEMIAPIRQSLEQGEKHAEYLKEMQQKQEAENTKMRRALRLLDPTYEAPVRRRRQGTPRVGVTRASGTPTGFGVTVEGCKPYAEKVLEVADRDGFVTQPAVYRALNSDQGTSSAAFKFFRDIGFLRKAGRDKESRREIWRILDRDAYHKALAQVEGKENDA